MGMPTSESIYGNPVNAKKAPEIINKLIVTLSPEQLFELIKQMKECIQVILNYYINIKILKL